MSQYKLNGENVVGFSQDGKDIKFTNTGTGLQADNVEDAIKEINTDLSVLLTEKKYNVPIESSQRVSPFTKFGIIAIPSADIQAYGRMISASCITGVGVNVNYNNSDGSLYIATSRSESSLTIAVVFAKTVNVVN